ncbi:MAG: hypothetical protein NVSMB31_13460 [Vulcanimicrobiaceae bacterium]
MNDWIIWASAQRRDELLVEAARVRLIRRILRRRPNILRGQVADGALIVSRALEHFAQSVRAKA